tara:strand:+ start:4809 stop:4991 length:183 start_codon:yes stop_codon:yes gene_type:complete
VKENIIDYLTLRHLSVEGFNPQDNQRIKHAYILAKIEYKAMNKTQRDEILKQLNKDDQAD